jgi:NADH:ubiquinone oxidoreductase subunit C
MFTSLKEFIELRLGYGLINNEIIHEGSFFIKTSNQFIDPLVEFLKNDPDVNLNALDTIFGIPKQCLPFTDMEPHTEISIVYQLRSLKLPYKVNVVIDINEGFDSIVSISGHFAGAVWLEADISQKYSLTILETRARIS